MPDPATHALRAFAMSVLAIGTSLSQPTSTFEVASVKTNKSDVRVMGNHFSPEHASWSNYSLKTLIAIVYGGTKIIGGAAWADSDTWDIEAKTESPTTQHQKFQMLQPLLADRFQLRVHRETRELPEYRMVLSGSGPKLQDSKPGDVTGTHVGNGLIEDQRMTMSSLASFLKGSLGVPVLDNTSLTGQYRVKLQWIPDEGQPTSNGVMPPADSIGPTIFSAIQEQLGLKLEAHKGPVEVLVIDHAEKPSAN